MSTPPTNKGPEDRGGGEPIAMPLQYLFGMFGCEPSACNALLTLSKMTEVCDHGCFACLCPMCEMDTYANMAVPLGGMHSAAE